tara:strand:- start:61 stop:534 length:474 start_codon:yes stop_codon:yes gene_type:complete
VSNVKCETVREWIPDYVSGRPSGLDVASLESHLETCDECKAEVGLARLIFESRIDAPDGLARRVREAVRSDHTSGSRPWWSISAAAVAALAIGISSNNLAQIEISVPGYAYESETGDLWLSDDGLIAGAPAFDGLTNEALLQLLDELDVGETGGAAS